MDDTPIKGPLALQLTIEIAQQAGNLASSFLKQPHDLEYEKTFMPFCLLSKKRYVGILYEMDHTSGKRKEMGIVLKRRDNAPIVKDVYGGIIDILMKDTNIEDAIRFLQGHLQNISDERTPIEKLIITKSLRGYYVNPKGIAHKVLADRIGVREPGCKPGSGDRISYIYVAVPNKKGLTQGDKIETPAFIKESRLKIDYSFYISNQIMKPVSQLFALVLPDVYRICNPRVKSNLSTVTSEKDRMDMIEDLLFHPFLMKTENAKKNLQPITAFFKPAIKR
jgi:DNA polymerase elongation subunit (family B)